MLGEQGVDAARQAEFRARFGLDQPLATQYWHYLTNALAGDVGTSITTRQPVLEEFLTLFPATLELASLALGLAMLVGIPAGVLSAVWRGSAFDLSLRRAATLVDALSWRGVPVGRLEAIGRGEQPRPAEIGSSHVQFRLSI
jgi:dipeptide transport system permease protein